jgi:hypothetical protein
MAEKPGIRSPAPRPRSTLACSAWVMPLSDCSRDHAREAQDASYPPHRCRPWRWRRDGLRPQRAHRDERPSTNAAGAAIGKLRYYGL